MKKLEYEPIISIIIPVYNVCAYLEKCVKSIIAQTYKKIEIVLVDDGSTDGCAQICDSFAFEDSRVKVIHKKNGGLVSARKAGTAAASGNYIISVDGDDWIDSNRVLHIVEHLQDAKVDLIYLDGCIKEYQSSSLTVFGGCPEGMYGINKMFEVIKMMQGKDNFWIRQIQLSLWRFCIRSDLLKNVQPLIDDRISMGEDLVCILGCALRAKSAILFREPSYHYLQRQNSITHTSSYASNKLSLVCLYQELCSLINESIYAGKMDVEVMHIMYSAALFMIYDYLLFPEDTFLFPFSTVPKETRIIVYGAGRLGVAMVKTLSKNPDYSLRLWVDRDTDRAPIDSFVVSPVSKILEMEYDYIVVTPLYWDTAMEIKCDLLGMGIPEEKIALIDKNVLTKERLEHALGVEDT